MTIREAGVLESHQIQLTGVPLRCSACFNQDPSRRHIDMDAACDRGYGNDEAVKVAYDDLVLCENCVKEAAMLIGMEKLSTMEDAMSDLARKVDLFEKERDQQKKYAEKLERLFDERPDKIEIDHRQKPRPLRTA